MAKKILLVEDDNILQNAMKEAVEAEGFEVVQAFDGEEGLEKAGSEKPDLILLDLIMPKKDGYHVLSELSGKYPDVPVIVLTVVSSESSVAECIAAGAKGYLIKSEYALNDIIKKIKEFV